MPWVVRATVFGKGYLSKGLPEILARQALKLITLLKKNRKPAPGRR
ncbi:MAG: hypothetical protein ACXWTP_12460 [Methylosarcina sp.]